MLEEEEEEEEEMSRLGLKDTTGLQKTKTPNYNQNRLLVKHLQTQHFIIVKIESSKSTRTCVKQNFFHTLELWAWIVLAVLSIKTPHTHARTHTHAHARLQA